MQVMSQPLVSLNNEKSAMLVSQINSFVMKKPPFVSLKNMAAGHVRLHTLYIVCIFYLMYQVIGIIISQ